MVEGSGVCEGAGCALVVRWRETFRLRQLPPKIAKNPNLAVNLQKITASGTGKI